MCNIFKFFDCCHIVFITYIVLYFPIICNNIYSLGRFEVVTRVFLKILFSLDVNLCS